MTKPLRLDICLGGFVILAELPTATTTDRRTGKSYPYCLGSIGGWDRFEQRLSDLPGYKEAEGPMINGLYAITFDVIDEPRLTVELARENVAACWQYRWANADKWAYIVFNMQHNLALTGF